MKDRLRLILEKYGKGDYANFPLRIDKICSVEQMGIDKAITAILKEFEGLENGHADLSDRLDKEGHKVEGLEKEIKRLQEVNKGLQHCYDMDLGDKKDQIKKLKQSQLTKDEFYTIACEYRPSIAKDSGQPEWTTGELDKLWEALTKGHWLYIDRPKGIDAGKLKEVLGNYFDGKTAEYICQMDWCHEGDLAQAIIKAEREGELTKERK